MKTIISIAILFISSLTFAQQSSDEILASNNINDGKIRQTILAEDFQQLNEESLNGVYKLLADNGKLKEVRTFDQGKMDGTWLKYDENENLIAIANYKNDKKHGKWAIWDENGTLRYELFYTDGERTGTWTSYDEQGKILSKKEY